jgi:hypothetical protein
MADNQLNEKDEDELIPVETPPETEAEQAEDHDDDDDSDDEDTRLADDDDDGDDEDDGRPSKTLKNRERRSKRRDIRRVAKERADAELRLLREQNDQLMRRMQALEGNSIAQNENAIEQRLHEAMQEAYTAEQIIAKAVEAGNGDDVATAMRLRDEAKQRAAQLQGVKHQLQYAKQQAAQPQVDQRVTNYAQEWLQANPWYDPSGRDEDSAITKAIDNSLAAEGWDPRSEVYWHELTRRVAARVSDDDAPSRRDAAPKRKAPPIGGGREHAPASTRKEVYVTPERKQAMIDAGVWDDPVARNRYLKAYQDYDKQSAR